MTTDEILREKGIVYLTGEINQASADYVTKEIIALNALEKNEFIQLIINSNGGHVVNGIQITEFIEWSRLPIYTVAIGQILSAGLFIFMAGAKGNRVITKSASVMSHRFIGGHRDTQPNLIAHTKENELTHERMVKHYLRHTKIKNKATLEKTLLRESDVWLTPEEAVKYGIADKII